MVWTSLDPKPRSERDGEVQENSPLLSEGSSEVVEPAFAHPEPLSVLAEDFERKSRKSATMSRLLEQHRRHLSIAQNERDELYDKLQQVMPVVQQRAGSLREAMNARRFEAEPQHFRELFDVNEKALNELGTLATALTADFIWLRSAWDQYRQAMQEAQRLR
jgi:hypothetical protein